MARHPLFAHVVPMPPLYLPSRAEGVESSHRLCFGPALPGAFKLTAKTSSSVLPLLKVSLGMEF